MKTPKFSKNATELPGMVPVNISSMYELYMGVKNTGSQVESAHEYDGARLSFDLELLEFTTVPGTMKHNSN